jgi:hypothetical protein
VVSLWLRVIAVLVKAVVSIIAVAMSIIMATVVLVTRR